MLPRGAFVDDFLETPDLVDVLEFAERTGLGLQGPADGDDSHLSPRKHFTHEVLTPTILFRRRLGRPVKRLAEGA